MRNVVVCMANAPRTAAIGCAVLCLAANSYGQWIEQQLHSFGPAGQSGANPSALIQGADGAFYGTTQDGGASGPGAVFKINSDGSGYTVLHSFTGGPGDGANPSFYAGLVQGNDGILYGTTAKGGTNGFGTVFKLSTNGTAYAVLYSFGANSNDGQSPYGGLMQASNGMLYGTTTYGGTNNFGTVFKLSTNGTGYAQLRSFNGADPWYPYAALVQGSDGRLYGTGSDSIPNFNNFAFGISTDGSSFSSWFFENDYLANPYSGLLQSTNGCLFGVTTGSGTYGQGTLYTSFGFPPSPLGAYVLHSFTGTAGDGAQPYGGLAQSNGVLYGTTAYGGTNGLGIIFKMGISSSPAYTVLHNFTGNKTDGAKPYTGLVHGKDGAFYGTSSAGGLNNWGTVFKLEPDGTGFTLLYSFSGSAGDGALPHAGLVQGVDGNLYGTTSDGGSNRLGTVFRMSTCGSGFTNLYSFAGTNSGDGAVPYGGVVQATDGALYGTTFLGGTSNYGTVFRLSTNGANYSVLYSFGAYGQDGQNPAAGLIQGTDGMLYGTTEAGGPYGEGTIFKLSTNGGGYAQIQAFNLNGTNNGCSPLSGLMQGNDGALYGMTEMGGASEGGIVFKVNTDGSEFTILHSFNWDGDGGYPSAALAQGKDRTLYGTTQYTVFTIAPGQTNDTILHNFGLSNGDGALSMAGLVQGSDGLLYGVTDEGGAMGTGTAFALATNGACYSVVYNFGASGGDGRNPYYAGLVQGSDGALYGTTYQGGSAGLGTVFRLTPPVPIFNRPVPTPDGNLHLTLCGATNTLWRVDTATALTSPTFWSPLTNVTTVNGTAQFSDLGATNYPSRFYRATWPSH